MLIYTDKVKLKQIFINLISNSFKFTEEGRIEAGCSNKMDHYLEFYVADTGIGIPLEQQTIIFDRFTQIYHGPSKFYGGTGLGLSIVKGLVELLSGKVWLESEPGKGTKFSFTFPYKTVLTRGNHQEDQQQHEFEFSGKILIVEDDFYNAEYIREILQENQVETFYAENGKDAMEMIMTNTPDLVVLDVRLPDILGYEVASFIKREKPAVKIIAQTAYASESDKQRAIQSGCDDYISKPIKRDLFLSKISRLLNKRKL